MIRSILPRQCFDALLDAFQRRDGDHAIAVCLIQLIDAGHREHEYLPGGLEVGLGRAEGIFDCGDGVFEPGGGTAADEFQLLLRDRCALGWQFQFLLHSSPFHIARPTATSTSMPPTIKIVPLWRSRMPAAVSAGAVGSVGTWSMGLHCA